MTTPPEARPKRYPAPEFPPRRPAAFALTPPAIFPSILGLLGLVLALRAATATVAPEAAPLVQFLAGLVVPLWGFAVLAYLVKTARRPAVVLEDLRVLPGRSGLATMTMGGMAAAALVAPFQPVAAAVLLIAALVGHGVLAILLVRLLLSLPPPGRDVNPTWHLSFVGFIVAAPGAVLLGWTGLATALLWTTLPVAVAIWGLSALQFSRSLPPAPLRPLLAIHLSPAAVLSLSALALGLDGLGIGLLVPGLAFGLLLVLSGRWLAAAGMTPMWGAVTFPLAALVSALLLAGGVWRLVGLGLLALAVVAIPAIGWWVLKRWPGGRLAKVTNAAEA
jgi:tellurite resistance protein